MQKAMSGLRDQRRRKRWKRNANTSVLQLQVSYWNERRKGDQYNLLFSFKFQVDKRNKK